MPRPADPIRELTEALQSQGKPSLAWVTRWSAGGAEPVRAAWKRSRDAFRMMQLLRMVGRDEAEPLFRALVSHVAWWDSPLAGVAAQVEAEASARLAEAVRVGVPDPPGLEALMAAYARGGVPYASALGCAEAVPRLERGEWPTGWIVQRAAFAEVPLRDEWPLVPLETQVRVLAYTEPEALRAEFSGLETAVRSRADEVRRGGDAASSAALEGYARWIAAGERALREGAPRAAADAFQQASAEAALSAGEMDLAEIVFPRMDALVARVRPTLPALLAGVDRARARGGV